MDKYNKIIAVLAIIFTVLYLIGSILLIIFTALKLVDVLTLLLSLSIGAINLLLIWALNNALYRIETLEKALNNKGIIKKTDLQEAITGYSRCANCGYQLFPRDTCCPNCGKKK